MAAFNPSPRRSRVLFAKTEPVRRAPPGMQPAAPASSTPRRAPRRLSAEQLRRALEQQNDAR